MQTSNFVKRRLQFIKGIKRIKAFVFGATELEAKLGTIHTNKQNVMPPAILDLASSKDLVCFHKKKTKRGHQAQLVKPQTKQNLKEMARVICFKTAAYRRVKRMPTKPFCWHFSQHTVSHSKH